MVAGLALGESTPGPLIMVNTFVGFVAGYHVKGNMAWGVIGATIATLATFVPCFVLIISGPPLIDRIRATGSFANSLNGVTISVVGVSPRSRFSSPATPSSPTATPTGYCDPTRRGGLHRRLALRIGVIPVVLTCAAVGIANTLLR